MESESPEKLLGTFVPGGGAVGGSWAGEGGVSGLCVRRGRWAGAGGLVA